MKRTLEERIGTLLSLYRELLRDLSTLKKLKDDENAKDRPLISDKDLGEAYKVIAEYCDAFDYDSVIDIIQSLERYSFPENEKERFEKLKKAVDNFDYDLIPGLLRVTG